MDERRAHRTTEAMSTHRVHGNILAVAFAMIGMTGCATAAGLPLKQVGHDIPLAGATDRIDYQSIDPQRHLLFIARLGSGVVTVFDLARKRVIANVGEAESDLSAKVPGVHGVLAVPELGEVFATATDRNELDVISERTFRIIAHAPAGVYPDGMTYDAPDHRLFISDEAGQTETVVDTRSNRRVATIAMGGEVGNSQYDPVSRRVLVDVQTRDDIVAINPQTNRIIARYKLPSICQDDHSLLLDVPARLAFVTCDGNAKLLLLNLRTMHVLSVRNTGNGPDVLAFDQKMQRLYVASESGVVGVYQLRGKTVKSLGLAYLAYEAHSVAIDPNTHLVYFPLQNVNGRAVLRIMEPTAP